MREVLIDRSYFSSSLTFSRPHAEARLPSQSQSDRTTHRQVLLFLVPNILTPSCPRPDSLRGLSLSLSMSLSLLLPCTCPCIRQPPLPAPPPRSSPSHPAPSSPVAAPWRSSPSLRRPPFSAQCLDFLVRAQPRHGSCSSERSLLPVVEMSPSSSRRSLPYMPFPAMSCHNNGQVCVCLIFPSFCAKLRMNPNFSYLVIRIWNRSDLILSVRMYATGVEFC